MKKISILLVLTFIIILLCGCNNSQASSNPSAPENRKYVTAVDDPKPRAIVDVVTVPNVVGMDKDEAVKVLEDLGLEAEIKIKRLQYKNIETTELYPDNIVLEQSHQNGIIVSKKSVIEITINKIENIYEYSKNSDGTITLNNCNQAYYPDKKIVFPKEYDGFTVSHIKSELIDAYASRLNVLIPNSIEIIGIPKYQFETINY